MDISERPPFGCRSDANISSEYAYGVEIVLNDVPHKREHACQFILRY